MKGACPEKLLALRVADRAAAGVIQPSEPREANPSVSESVEHDKLTITVWSMGGGTSICFELYGHGQADPDLLAQNLASIRPMFDDDLTDSRED